MQRRDVAQQCRSLGGIGGLAVHDRVRIVASPAMECCELLGQAVVLVRRGKQVIHDGDGHDANGDRGAARHRGFENGIRRVDLVDRHERYGVAGEHRGISAVAVRQHCRIDAEADPGSEGKQQQVPGLREGADQGDSGRGADDCGEEAEARLLQHLPTRRSSENGDRSGGGGRRFQLQPEGGAQGDDDGDPDAERERPGDHGEARETGRTEDGRAGHRTI
jgi:hypothetical protein